MTTLTIRQAAEATGRDRRTISRRLAQGAYPGAYKDAAGVWQIPSEALALDAPVEIDHQADNADLLRRAEVAEALAAERDRTISALTEERASQAQTIQALTLALASVRDALNAAKAPVEIEQGSEAPEPERRRRRWGRRRQ
jgi:hypothetical protein